MKNEIKPALNPREWVILTVFIAILAALIVIAIISDVKVDVEIEKFMSGAPS